jgi:hypothetical protein
MASPTLAKIVLVLTLLVVASLAAADTCTNSMLTINGKTLFCYTCCTPYGQCHTTCN